MAVASGEEVDVVVHQDHYVNGDCGYRWDPDPEGLNGLTTCRSITADGACRRHDVWYDSSYTSSVSEGAQRVLACHELGHTVSLTHYYADCMDGTANPSGIQWPCYSTHSKSEINSHY